MSTTTVERTELARFLTIAGHRHQAGEKLPEMFSGAVDAYWHHEIGTSGYAAFSTEHAGAVVGHSPVSGHGAIEWVTAYEETYGPLPEIWFTDEKGVFDEAAFTTYRETGRIEASWNCGPDFADETAE